eukprot:698774-Rhodomonas_salina.2
MGATANGCTFQGHKPNANLTGGVCSLAIRAETTRSDEKLSKMVCFGRNAVWGLDETVEVAAYSDCAVFRVSVYDREEELPIVPSAVLIPDKLLGRIVVPLAEVMHCGDAYSGRWVALRDRAGRVLFGGGVTGPEPSTVWVETSCVEVPRRESVSVSHMQPDFTLAAHLDSEQTVGREQHDHERGQLGQKHRRRDVRVGGAHAISDPTNQQVDSGSTARDRSRSEHAPSELDADTARSEAKKERGSDDERVEDEDDKPGRVSIMEDSDSDSDSDSGSDRASHATQKERSALIQRLVASRLPFKPAFNLDADEVKSDAGPQTLEWSVASQQCRLSANMAVAEVNADENLAMIPVAVSRAWFGWGGEEMVRAFFSSR